MMSGLNLMQIVYFNDHFLPLCLLSISDTILLLYFLMWCISFPSSHSPAAVFLQVLHQKLRASVSILLAIGKLLLSFNLF
jgi:hypothetical protein